MSLRSECRFVRRHDLIATDMDGETVMMSLERGEYFGLQGVGPRIWELLEERQTVDQLTKIIVTEYDVDESICRADIQELLDSLLLNNLVQRA